MFVHRGKSARLEKPAVRRVSEKMWIMQKKIFFNCWCWDFNWDVCVCVCEGIEPECRRTVGTLDYVKVDDCQSDQRIELHYCEVRSNINTNLFLNRNLSEIATRLLTTPPLPACPRDSSESLHLSVFQGKCRSKSMYSLQRAAVEQECVCCSAVGTEPLSVPVLCANGTRSHHTVLSVTACDCLSKHCTWTKQELIKGEAFCLFKQKYTHKKK